MGRDKASLPFGNETMLARVVRIVREVADEVVVVAREGQEVAGDFALARDGGRGPLDGLAAGLRALIADRAFLTSCDAPFLKPAYVARMLEYAAGHDAAVPLVDGYHMMTSAVYAKRALPVAEKLLAAGRLRPLFLVESVHARIVAPDELRDVDPDLASFRNCNTPEEYERALRDAGIS